MRETKILVKEKLLFEFVGTHFGKIMILMDNQEGIST